MFCSEAERPLLALAASLQQPAAVLTRHQPQPHREPVAPKLSFYPSAAHRCGIAWLGQALVSGDPALLIGPPGWGKTRLAAHWTSTVDPDRVAATTCSAEDVSRHGALGAAARAFGLATDEHPVPVLQGFLAAQAGARRRAMLLVDGCEHLSAAEAHAVLELAMLGAPANGRLHLVLLGQVALATTFPVKPDTGPRCPAVTCRRLHPLDPEDVGGYVRHRLASVGWPVPPAFSADFYNRLAVVSEGLPGRINPLLARMLQPGVDSAVVLINTPPELERDGHGSSADQPPPAAAASASPFRARAAP